MPRINKEAGVTISLPVKDPAHAQT